MSYTPRFPKRNKFNAKKIKDCDGKIVADSKAERDYLLFNLALKEKSGLITDITKWPTVQMTDYIKWKLDYSYIEVPTKKLIYVDVKGVEGERFRLLKALWKTVGKATLEIAKKDYASGTFKIERVTGGLE